MKQFLRGALVAALLVPAGVVVGDVAPAGAAAPTVSVTNGPPGTSIEVTSTECDEPFVGDDFTFLEARLITGTAPNEVLAGAGSGVAGLPATMIVPDWIDPADPAAIETACISVVYDAESGEETRDRVVLDPVVFDVEPGAGAPVQSRSFSRTSLLVGQALTVSGSGCTLPGAESGEIALFAGADLAGRTFEALATFGEGEIQGTDFEYELYLSNGSTEITVSQFDDETPVIEGVAEVPTDLAPGTYTAVPLCAAYDTGVSLFFEPQLIEVTDSAPIGDVDLTVAAGSRNVTFAGGECADGPVEGALDAYSAQDIGLEFARATESRATPDAVGPLGFRRSADRSGTLAGPTVSQALRSDAEAGRALADVGSIEFSADPDAEGGWSVSDTAGFDEGLVEGFAVCGDPFADGFVYDPQITVVDAEPVTPPTTPPTTPATTTPPAASTPASAVRARPTYAG